MDKDKSYEIEILKYWKDNNIYEKVKDKNKGNEKFNSVDGPPYPTGEPHLGHARNWAIKDTVLRYKRLKGYDVYVKDGYDAHGLPVENKTQNKLNLKTVDDIRKFGIDNFIEECKKYALSIIDDMTENRDRIGLWMDRNYYYTFHPEYISLSWRFFKEAEKKGLLYKGYKTVAWCPNDETTLSDYEIKDSYQILEDPSVYIKFPIKKEFRISSYEESLLIWTTTPWTLQSNLAIAVNPNFEYSWVLVEINGKKEVFVIASSLIDRVVEKLSKTNTIKVIEVLKIMKGVELEGIKYEHILKNETPSQQEFEKLDNKFVHSVILADFVTLGGEEDIIEKLEKKGYKHQNVNNNEESEEDKVSLKKDEGTGLVHIAPGHGFDDYNVGVKYGLPIFCPVNEKGKFDEGLYKGEFFRDTNKKFIDYLKKEGFLLNAEYKKHKYPTCWRCKTPIVYRAAEQWWIKRTSYKDEIIELNKNVKWFPSYAKTSFNNLFEKTSDWPISRQRFWGIPLPIWECKKCGDYIVIGSKEELEKKSGHKLDDLHLQSIRNIKFDCECGGKKEIVGYIADVWFDSGCASFASHYNEGLSFDEILKEYYPIKWITEGEDQVRGWFSSLFNVGYVITGKAPYKEVLFYKYVMDKEGRKMSKSLGNGISFNEAIKLWGADLTRYYLITKNLPEEQINMDIDEVKDYGNIFLILKNIFKFVNNYLKEYKEYTNVLFDKLNIEDKWIIYKFNKTIQEFEFELEKYRLNVAFKKLENFLLTDFSRKYLKMVKERAEDIDNNLYYTFSYLLRNILIAFSPVIPFITEKLYLDSVLEDKKESIFLESFPKFDEFVIEYISDKKIDEAFELSLEIIQNILNLREKVKIGVRWPLPEIIIFTEKVNVELLKDVENLILKQTNIKKISYNRDIGLNYRIKPNFVAIKNDFENVSEIIKIIKEYEGSIINCLVNNENVFRVNEIEIDLNKHIIKEEVVPEGFVLNRFTKGFIVLNYVQDEILKEEGYLREMIRRIQILRKDLNLIKKDKIVISFRGSSHLYNKISENWKEYILKKVNAENIVENDLNNKVFKIKDEILSVGIKKIS